MTKWIASPWSTPLTGERLDTFRDLVVFPATHYAASAERMRRAILGIEAELAERLRFFEDEGPVAGSSAPAHAHLIRPGNDDRAGVLQRH